MADKKSKSKANGTSTSTPTATASTSNAKAEDEFFSKSTIVTSIALVIAFGILLTSYRIRLMAIADFGPVIHEFDPYFNFRATEYLYDHGRTKFFQWFDYMSWYPLGRPVGTTIYPGMQFTAVWIKNHIVGDSMSLNDVCCYIPAWFGVLATFLTGMLAYECSLPVMTDDEEPFESILENIPFISFVYRKAFIPIMDFIFRMMEKTCGTSFGLRHKSVIPGSFVDASSPAVEIALVSAMVMSVVPAHLMRSMGGGFDNESVAMAAMVLTFYLWTRSLRGSTNIVSNATWIWGIAAGVAYFNMVAAWGGYVFVINLIGVHAGLLVLFGRYSTKLYRAYTAFYVVGTFLAMQIPVVGWTPIKSLEQLGPCAVFVGFQLLEFVESQRRRKKLSVKRTWKLRIQVFVAAAFLVFAIAGLLSFSGYFGPISARVRGLFVKHTKTGNPLVDSVAEHQPAQASAYEQYLGRAVVPLIPIGFALVAFRYFHDSSSFLLVYGVATYFFSLKMVRLILLTAPIASVLVGIAVGRMFGFLIYNILGFVPAPFPLLTENETGIETGSKNNGAKVKKSKNSNGKSKLVEAPKPSIHVLSLARSLVFKLGFTYALYIAVNTTRKQGTEFFHESQGIGRQFSNPTIVQKGNTQNGDTVIVDDYRDCYNWIRKNTPEDARIMAWWDYGYQLTAIANRTTIADGNTWNHEHIALLGRALTSPEKEGHRIARHLADYMLVWAGGGGDDVAKSPHLARIANSVYRDMCPDDPVCSKFGYTKQGMPSLMMRESLLYKLHSHGLKPGVIADPNRFREKYTSKYGKCRVFKILSVSKESKEWVANPANRKCDAPGSWFCPGQYPPGMQKILKEKRDFSQLEDFNRKDKDSEYQKKYFENLAKKNSGQKIESTEAPKKKGWKPNIELSPEQIAEINKYWEDSEVTSTMWELISGNRIKSLVEILTDQPELAHARSKDGRGPMFWAMEFGNEKIVRILKKVGVSTTVKDAKGLTPLDLKKSKIEL